MVVKKSTKRTCVTCTAKGVNKDEVPLWSKKDGLYSMLPKVLNCEDTYNPNKQELKEETPEIVGTRVEIPLEILEKNRWVFYWAAEPGVSLEGDKPEDPATSYGDESNRGLVKTDKDGNATLVLNCPKLYKEDKQLYPRHVHYTVLTKDDVWATKIGTLEIMCKLSLETMKKIVKKKSYLILDALSKESYEEKHIPNSFLLHHESLKNLTKQKKDGIIKQLIKDNLEVLPLVQDFVDSAESIKDTPIIVYCAHSECEASSKLADHLYSCGFFNVLEYPGGLKEWFDSEEGFFEDAQSEEEVEGDEDEEDVVSQEIRLTEKEEDLVYDGVLYIHNTETDEILTKDDLDVVGKYDGEEIEWNSTKEYKKHMKRVKELGAMKKKNTDGDEDDAGSDDDAEDNDDAEDDNDDDDEQDADSGSDDEENPVGEESESSSSSSSSESDSDDEEAGALQHKKVGELKELLKSIKHNHDKLMKTPKTKHEYINCIMKCKKKMRGGGYVDDSIMYGGGVNQKTYNNNFRGWGFTFNM